MSQTVTKAIEILRFVADEPRSLTEVARHMDVHKSTVSRLLAALERDGLTRRTSDGKHALGFKLLFFAERVLGQIDLRSIAHEHVVALSRKVGQTVHLAQLIGDEVIYVDKVDGPGPIALASRIGVRAEYHTSGVAKAILAYLDQTTRRRLLGNITYQPYTTTTITSPTALQRELDLVRRRGWAVDDGEKEDFIRCIACPVFDAQGKVTVSLSVTALQAATPLSELTKMLGDLQETASAISHQIGGVAPAASEWSSTANPELAEA